MEEIKVEFPYPPNDPEKSDKENAEMREAYLKPIRAWMKGKKLTQCKLVEKDGVATFTLSQ